MPPMLRTIIIDSHADSRGHLRRIVMGAPSVMLVGEFRDIPEALTEAPACHPDVLIVEIPAEQERTNTVTSAIEDLVQTLPDAAIFVTGASASGDLVIQAIRAGALDFLNRPVKQEELLAALGKVARYRRTVTTPRRHGRVASVFSTKGGVGVTTVATNLAVCWAERAPGQTLLVDLDTRQSDIATFLNLRHTYSILDAFQNVGRMDESFLRGLLIQHPSGLWVLPGPTRIERAKLSADQVKRGLQILCSHFDHVVLDLPHDLDAGTIAALEASDMVLFLVSLSVSALRLGAAGLAAFRQLGLDLQKVRLVVMREGTGEDVTLKHVRETLEIPIYWKTPSDYPTVVTAINNGEPVVTAAPRSKVGKNLRQFCDLLANWDAAAVESSATRRASPFRLMWSPNPIRGAK